MRSVKARPGAVVYDDEGIASFILPEKRETKSTRTLLLLKPSTKAELERIASRTKKGSVNNLINRIITQYLKAHGAKRKAR